MYVQASEHFPGIILDLGNRTLRFSIDKFIVELEEALAHFDEPAYFDASDTYSVVYRRFLEMDLSSYPAIRGQLKVPSVLASTWWIRTTDRYFSTTRYGLSCSNSWPNELMYNLIG